MAVVCFAHDAFQRWSDEFLPVADRPQHVKNTFLHFDDWAAGEDDEEAPPQLLLRRCMSDPQGCSSFREEVYLAQDTAHSRDSVLVGEPSSEPLSWFREKCPMSATESISGDEPLPEPNPVTPPLQVSWQDFEGLPSVKVSTRNTFIHVDEQLDDLDDDEAPPMFELHRCTTDPGPLRDSSSWSCEPSSEPSPTLSPRLSATSDELSEPEGETLPLPQTQGHEGENREANAVAEQEDIWEVDARRFKGKDQSSVHTSHFQIGAINTDFTVTLKAKTVKRQRGGSSFAASGGVGSITIKADGLQADVGLKFVVGGGSAAPSAAPISIRHNFAESTMCYLECEFNFLEHVDQRRSMLKLSLSMTSFEPLGQTSSPSSLSSLDRSPNPCGLGASWEGLPLTILSPGSTTTKTQVTDIGEPAAAFVSRIADSSGWQRSCQYHPSSASLASPGRAQPTSWQGSGYMYTGPAICGTHALSYIAGTGELQQRNRFGRRSDDRRQMLSGTRAGGAPVYQ